MKKINKTEPSFYTNFVKKNKPNNWENCFEITYPIRKYILENEQNFQCAYCEGKISPDKTKSHIDHFKRKAGHLFPELTCDYFNLLVSCNNPCHCAKHKDRTIKKN